MRAGAIRLVSLVMPAIALACFAIVAGIAWEGGRWEAFGLAARNPVPRLVGGFAALAGWYVLRQHARDGGVRWLVTVGRFALFAASLGLSFLGAEWLFRIHLEDQQGFGSIETLQRYEEGGIVQPRSTHPVALLITLSENKRLIYELRRGMDQQFGPYRVLSNLAGLRATEEYDEAKPPSVVRILGIGDSGMFGWDVPQDGNYLALLERRLGARSGEITHQVLNAGVPGYNTQQEVEWLASRGLRFGPDVVVVGWCNNDFDAPFFLYRPVSYFDQKGSLLFGFLFDRKKFAEKTKPQVDLYTAFGKGDIHPDILEGMGVEGVEKVFSRLARLAQQNRFRVLVFGPLPASVIRVSEQLGFDVYDTYAEIDTGKYPDEYAVHEMHPSPEGHQVLAEHLERALRRHELIASPPSTGR